MKNKILSFFLGFILAFSACSKSKSTELSEEASKKFTDGKYLFIKGQFKGAIKFFDEVLSENENFINARIMNAKSLFYLGAHKKSLSQITMAEKISPSNPLVLFWKAKILMTIGSTDASFKILSNLVVEDPYNFRAHYELAKLYRAKKDFKGALKEYRECLTIEQTLLKIRMDIVALYRDLQFKDKAKELLSEFEKPYKNLIKNKILKENFTKLGNSLK